MQWRPKLRHFKLLLILCLTLSTPAWASVNLQGDADYITLANESNFDLGTAFTIWARVSLDTLLTNDRNIITKYDTSGNNRSWVLQFKQSAGEFRCLIVGPLGTFTNYRSIDSNVSVSADTIYDVGCVATNYDTTDLDMYVDGVDVSSATTSGGNPGTPYNNSLNPTIGAINSSSPTQFFNGSVHELAIWDVALSATEMAHLSSSNIRRLPLQIQSDDLIAYYTLDDLPDGHAGIAGDTFHDESGNGNTGTGVDADGDSLGEAETELSYP